MATESYIKFHHTLGHQSGDLHTELHSVQKQYLNRYFCELFELELRFEHGWKLAKRHMIPRNIEKTFCRTLSSEQILNCCRSGDSSHNIGHPNFGICAWKSRFPWGVANPLKKYGLVRVKYGFSMGSVRVWKTRGFHKNPYFRLFLMG